MRNRAVQSAKLWLKSYLKAIGVGVISTEELDRLSANSFGPRDIELLLNLFPASPDPASLMHLREALQCLPESKSQYGQDIFALSRVGFKSGGFFVEFGATNGIELSNTYLLEKRYGWTGILAEPARYWHQELRLNRNASLETSCVWRETGSVLEFSEAERAGLSSISQFVDGDLHSVRRARAKRYSVPTISLQDMLVKHGAPNTVDFLSVDTEGSELEILSSFDFGNFQFRTIVCEHNYTPAREQIFDLLTSRGYERVLAQLSHNDDWYVHSGL